MLTQPPPFCVHNCDYQSPLFHAARLDVLVATPGTDTFLSLRQVATKRIRELTELDLDAEAAKPNSLPLMWAVFAAFLK